MRLHRTPQQQQLVLHLVDAFDVGPVALVGEDFLLERVGLGLEAVQHRKVVVDDEVHDRIDDEALPHREHLRHAFAARAHLAVGGGRAVAHRDHVAAPGEDVRLAELDLVFDQLRSAQRDEH